MVNDLEAGWVWTIGGILLLMLEMLAPGVFLIFIGVAAIATGIFTLMFGLALPGQLALFVVYSLLAVLAGRRIYANKEDNSSDPFLNDPAARLVGRVVTVIEAVDEHGGRVRVGDSDWSARGGPARAGERVRVAGVDEDVGPRDVELERLEAGQVGEQLGGALEVVLRLLVAALEGGQPRCRQPAGGVHQRAG